MTVTAAADQVGHKRVDVGADNADNVEQPAELDEHRGLTSEASGNSRDAPPTSAAMMAASMCKSSLPTVPTARCQSVPDDGAIGPLTVEAIGSYEALFCLII